jgi:hypothetical protein
MTELESRTLCIDLDQTLCASSGDYAKAEPVPGAQEALSRLREAGWVIVLHTARHFNHWQVTVDWLAQHGFVYDQIVFGKPPARFYIDDRAIPFDGNWDGVCRKLAELGSGHNAQNV